MPQILIVFDKSKPKREVYILKTFVRDENQSFSEIPLYCVDVLCTLACGIGEKPK